LVELGLKAKPRA
jgi:hypothetical protein